MSKILLHPYHYNIANGFLTATGFLKELKAVKGRSRLTLFLKVHRASEILPHFVDIQSFGPVKKTLLIKAHVCKGYFRLALLQSTMQQNFPTFATYAMGVELYMLIISSHHRIVTASSGIVEAKLVKILYDHKPIVVYGVSKVLFPKEIFGNTL
ncbi:hypothetical protein TSUD_409750 [Trifolium subterraneum]|uniref:Uncharacterized protein n=1 Tax=Trifolium subterraneum TaxID=3900 RepID=A0A2Z6PHA5_TRISU|nr:hypothetical protein TSUD_409750 [Trifolium subterraneum]